MFKSTIGTHYKSLKIEYVDSDLYTSTGHSWSLLLTHKNCHFQCQYYYKPITVRSGVTVIQDMRSLHYKFVRLHLTNLLLC